VIPPVNSITAAEAITGREHPHATDFQSVFDGHERIGWTYQTGTGGHAWITGDGTTSARTHTNRDTAATDAINTHRSKP